MKSFVALALAASAIALPQQSSGSGCEDSRDGSFQISVVNVTDSSSKRSVERRQLSGTLTLTLEDGVLKDQAGRDGYIASNHQFQFDQPIQDGALETSGFSVCSNGTLALGGSAIWYQCYSGGFYNLYDESQGKQCNPIYIYAQSSGGSTATASGAVSQATDGQPAASTQVSAPAVSQITDGQPQAPTSQAPPPVTQISDGQPQAPTSQGSAPVVSQISDGQPQAPTSQAPAPVVSQISDGQPQAPTSQAPLVSQISDGQPQAPTGAPVTQISDGQVQAPTGAPLVSQISDGQPQAPVATPSGPLVSQISDGQPQAPTGNYTAPSATSPTEFTGAAATPIAAAGALVAGLMGMVAML
ncbi:hypothetical protein N0V90_005702 [Kalmusia sp. IMI 367209]|nr:hypothetical protein N0V90_005702 [Kalmusia sp. IMI 367209]